jgi:hydrogenase maturation protein HypF
MRTQTQPQPPIPVRVKIALHGAVQGVGFRPFVYRLATEMALGGWVNNSPQGVFLEAESPRPILEEFLRRLQTEKPPHSFIQSLETTWLDAAGFDTFEIRASEAAGEKCALVLPDIGTCPECLAEIQNPKNRRYQYPFTNCTHCGPRFSIIEALPYDRANTTMEGFKMCAACRREYENPRDRRFHAQPNACPACGPHLEYWDAGAPPDPNWPVPDPHRAKRKKARSAQRELLTAADAIRAGKIVAVKGIGGFHLMVDARNDAAVRTLRERKQREEKPFALLFPSLDSVRAACAVSPLEAALLTSPEAPIVLLDRLAAPANQAAKADGPFIARAVAPGNPNLGVMLPSNPVHHLLLAELGFPVVATSGNLSDEPICIDEREALERLRDIADGFLVHDRPIARHVDDSIVRVVLGREMILRRARGYAPLPIEIPSPNHRSRRQNSILAVGGHLKNSIALSIGSQVFISQHIGDLETAEAERAFRNVIDDFQRLYSVQPDLVAADRHPDYVSTRFANRWSQRNRRGSGAETVVSVQHHVAHALSCIAENEIQLPALAVAWDGTGFGLDGTIWGGEFFAVTGQSVERVASLRPFPLPGSHAAVREPRRAALGMLFEMMGEAVFEQRDLPPMAAFTVSEISLLRTMLQREVNSPRTSSIGRWFDAVASLAGLKQQMAFEGQAAMELEHASAGIGTDDLYSLPLVERDGPCLLDWAPAMEEMIREFRQEVPAGLMAAKFHNTLAEAVVTVARRFSHARVALSGGCFQNRRLLERTVRRLEAENFHPYWHQRVPTNDGGIALGQIAAAIRGEHVNFESKIANTNP